MRGAPRLIYLHGFASSPGSKKARFLAARLAGEGIELEIPDLTAGDFAHTTISRQLDLLGQTVHGDPVILLGSSLGGYLAALFAARHAEVTKLLMLAPAFGFHQRWTQVLGRDAVREWERNGFRRYFHYGTGQEEPLHVDFLRDAARHEPFPVVSQTSLILHGRADEVAPVESSRVFQRRNRNCDLVILESDHGLLDVTDQVWTRARRFLGLLT